MTFALTCRTRVPAARQRQPRVGERWCNPSAIRFSSIQAAARQASGCSRRAGIGGTARRARNRFGSRRGCRCLHTAGRAREPRARGSDGRVSTGPPTGRSAGDGSGSPCDTPIGPCVRVARIDVGAAVRKAEQAAYSPLGRVTVRFCTVLNQHAQVGLSFRHARRGRSHVSSSAMPLAANTARSAAVASRIRQPAASIGASVYSAWPPASFTHNGAGRSSRTMCASTRSPVVGISMITVRWPGQPSS